MADTRKRFAALDTGFLLALAGDLDGPYQETIDRLMQNSFFCLVPPTVIQELQSIVDDEEDEEFRFAAANALGNIAIWGFIDSPLMPVEHGIAEQIARTLLARKIVEVEEEAVRLIVAEAALLDCLLLVSERPALTRVNNLTLGFALLRHDVTDVAIKTPAQILGSLSG